MKNATFLCDAEMFGRLVYVNRYPGLIDGVDKVKGEVYEVDAEDLATLDAYEGCFCEPPDYKRELRRCLFCDGTEQLVNVYVFQLIETSSFTIPQGDWRAYMELHPELNS